MCVCCVRMCVYGQAYENIYYVYCYVRLNVCVCVGLYLYVCVYVSACTSVCAHALTFHKEGPGNQDMPSCRGIRGRQGKQSVKSNIQNESFSRVT